VPTLEQTLADTARGGDALPMPQLRDAAAGLFHITAHSVRSTELFRDDLDRILFLTELAATASKFGWKCVCVCLMTTHYHLIVETPDASLPAGMFRINFRHARRFNARHGLRGHAFDRRYFSKRITDEAHLLATYAYVVRNPIEAGLCGACDDWPWCSYGSLFKPSKPMSFVDPSCVLGCFGEDRDFALEQLRACVEGSVAVL
jgi:REP element-mobilizing transposase RayT